MRSETSGPAHGREGREKRAFKIATFNVHNLVLPGVLFHDNESYDQQSYSEKIGWLGHQLRKMDADLIGFQEVFHQVALEEALRRGGLTGMRAITASQPDMPGESGQPGESLRSPMVGLATSFEVNGYSAIARIPEDARMAVDHCAMPIETFSRPVLRAEILFPVIGPAIVYVVHLKSKRPDIAEGENEADPMVIAHGEAASLVRRAVEAMGVRSLVLKDLVDYGNPERKPVLVLGDFNDEATAVTTSIICGAPPSRQLPPEEKQRVWGRLLRSVVEIQSRQSLHGAYYSYIHKGRYESLDHILVSDEFSPVNGRRIADIAYVHILTDHLVDTSLSRERPPRMQSDHGQVIVTIRPRSFLAGR